MSEIPDRGGQHSRYLSILNPRNAPVRYTIIPIFQFKLRGACEITQNASALTDHLYS